jgi:hypothetical protein
MRPERIFRGNAPTPQGSKRRAPVKRPVVTDLTVPPPIERTYTGATTGSVRKAPVEREPTAEVTMPPPVERVHRGHGA